ncbi:MAG: Glu/Leu/Phe/Val dehydrogenase dimerization domain-containing protein [Kiloniellales bacterium]
MLFAHPEFDGHEEVVFGHDPKSGLNAIVAIHNRNRGNALGGCRMWPYACEAEALTDALRLSRGMTYKSALANLPFGGGKSVIIGDPREDKSEALLRAMGRLVETLGGAYVIAEDVGMGVSDIETMARETRHVAGVSAGNAGDPSPATAYGVFVGIEAAVAHRLGKDSLDGVIVAVQGLGHVGQHLCARLAEAGARLLVADLNETAVKFACSEYGAKAVAPERIVAADAEVFAPCALGAVIDDRSIGALRAKVVAGSANNQLAEPRHGLELRRRGILYAPDYVINAGGVIFISHEGPSFDRGAALTHVGAIEQTLTEIFERAEDAGISTSEAADRIAEERFKTKLAPHSKSKAA